MSAIFARDITVLRNLSLAQLIIPLLLVTCNITFADARYLVYRMCYGRITYWVTAISWRIWHRSISRNHQNPRNAVQRTNKDHESELHGTQIPSNQSPPIQ